MGHSDAALPTIGASSERLSDDSINDQRVIPPASGHDMREGSTLASTFIPYPSALIPPRLLTHHTPLDHDYKLLTKNTKTLLIGSRYNDHKAPICSLHIRAARKDLCRCKARP